MRTSVKVRINKSFLASIPEPLRSIVAEWKLQYRKAKITVTRCDQFYASEDARITAISLLTGAEVSVRAAGEFAGLTKLSPTARIPVVPGVLFIERGFFCGVPFLTIYESTNGQPAASPLAQISL